MKISDILLIIDKVLHYKLFDLNKTPVTLSSLVMFLVVLAVFYVVAKLLDGLLKSKIFPHLKIESGLRYTLLRVNHYLIMIIGAIVAFQFVGINLSGLAVIFGLLSVGIGFGLQNVTSNFVAGLILLFERPIKIGDRVTIGDTQGDVMAINMRATTVRSLNNISIIVPNSQFISSQVINWSHGDPTIRLDVPVGVAYESDLDTVLRSLREVAAENENVLDTPEPDVIFLSFGDSAWNMELRVWLKDPYRYYQILSDINCAIVRKFRENNVEVPFPQRDLHLRSAEPLPVIHPEKSEPS